MTINDVKLLNLRTFIEPDGNLVPVESKHDIPFDIKLYEDCLNIYENLKSSI